MRRLALLAVPALSLLASLVILMLSTWPSMARASKLKEETVNLKESLLKAEEEAKAVAIFLQRDEKVIRAAFRLIRERTRALDRPSDTYPIVMALAEKSGVSIQSLTAQVQERPIEPVETSPEALSTTDAEAGFPPEFKTFPVSISVTGPPERILDFMELIENHERPMTIQRAEMARDAKRFLQARAQMLIHILASRG